MATMNVYRPECDRSECSGRATFQITSARGVVSKWCGAHAKTALFDLTKAEGAVEHRDTETVKAVRS